MQGVHAGHAEVERQEELHLGRMRTLVDKAAARHEMRLEFVGILDGFDAKKHQA